MYQFARDAAVAEAWLIAQEPYLLSSELGHTIDEVENLIKKHEAFEKSAAAQEERFSALERLTTVSLLSYEFFFFFYNIFIYLKQFLQFELKEMKRRQELAEEAERQRIKEEMEAKVAAEAAEQAKREAEQRDAVDIVASEEAVGK